MTSNRRSASQRISKTEELDVTFGAFERDGFRVPFMSTVLTVQQIKDYFSLVTDDAKYANQDWSLEELYQRDIDWYRVENMVKEYLGQGSSRPAFFNSLTMVLMQGDKPGHGYSPPNPVNFNFHRPIGPIQINFDVKQKGENYPAACTFGSIAWNRHEVKAVAIDGQHRLAALKEWKEDDANRTSLSVLLLIIDKEFGFITPRSKTNQIPQMRSIFIDLNKHAKPVSRARNLLLDDRDPHANQLRSLISPNLTFSYSKPKIKNKWKLDIGSSGEFENKIPLNFVDWHGEGKSKIETGPYLTSILAIDWFIQRVACSGKGKRLGNLDLSNLSVDDDEYYKKLMHAVSLWPKASKKVTPGIKVAEASKSQYTFSTVALQAVEKEFLATWGSAFMRTLVQTSPYAEIVNLRIKENTLTHQFGQWYQAKDLLESNKKRSRSVVKRYEDKLEEIEDELRRNGHSIDDFGRVVDECNQLKDGNVLFYLTGQRALLFALGHLVDTQEAANWASLTNKKLSHYGSPPTDFYADFLITALNKFDENCKSNLKISVFHREISPYNAKGDLAGLSTKYWAGSICDRFDPTKIDFNESGARRASRLFVLMTQVYWYKKSNGHRKDKLRKELLSGTNLASYQFGSEIQKAIENCLGKFDEKNNEYPLGFHIRKLGEEEDQKHYDALKKATLEFVFDNC